jgi:hypothetical protein
MGAYVSTNSKSGAFAIGDYSTGTVNSNDTTNQMMMRFAGGYKLYTNSAATIGAQLVPGGNSWSTISDVRKKEKFAPVNGEAFLQKIAAFKLTSWNYKGQDAKHYRHYGPMAQDFYAAFGKDSYGTIGNDSTINQADMEGVSFVAIQALVHRTDELQKRVKDLEAANANLTSENGALKAELELQNKNVLSRIEAMEAEMQRGKIGLK